MVQNQRKTLPNELWIRVLHSFANGDNLPALWMTCRQVSVLFRDTAESIFREKYLSSVKIDFKIGRFDPNNTVPREMDVGCEYGFSKLSDDSSTAFFQRLTLPRDPDSIIEERLSRYMNPSRNDISSPKHYISIRRDINDSPIPRLSFENNFCRMSCDWRGMLTAFYSEEQLHQQLTVKWTMNQDTWMNEVSAKVTRGQISMEQALSQALDSFVESTERNRQMARRTRIQHQLRMRGDAAWNFDGDIGEQADLTTLKKLRQMLATEFFSDEEEDEEDEEDEEWEDEGDNYVVD